MPGQNRERKVFKVVRGVDTSDGAGVRLTRVIGVPDLLQHDPFLLLDRFSSDKPDEYIGGFPPHPHRGFETVTYMIAGEMEHEDSAGNRGILKSGGVQWMTAGRGVIHSEMPRQESGLMQGFQLWLNLPKKEKMCEPRYQNIEPDEVPEVQLSPGVKVKVIAGEIGGMKGPVQGVYTDPEYYDLAMDGGSSVDFPVSGLKSCFLFVYQGSLLVSGELVEEGSLALLGEGDQVRVVAEKGPAKALVVAAVPIGEPIARGGPFVMNTREEIMQAYRDYESGKFDL